MSSGWKALKEGRLDDARKWLTKASQEAQKFKPADPRLGLTWAQLAWLNFKEGKSREADDFAAQAEQVFAAPGQDQDQELIQGLNTLALLLQQQKKYAKSEVLFNQALDKAKPQPSLVLKATLKQNLAGLLEAQGRFREAARLHDQALADLEQGLGDSSPELAAGLESAARFQRNRRNHARAEALYRRVLEIQSQALGQDHLDVARTQGSLAEVASKQRKFKDAEELLRQALATRAARLGEKNLATAQIQHNLATVLGDQHKYAEAEQLFDKALETRTKQLGKENLRVAATQLSLANLQRNQKRYDKAEPLYQNALAIRQKALGPERPEVAEILESLALMNRKKGVLPKAAEQYQQALAIRLKAQPGSRAAAATMHNLANLQMERGQYPEAQKQYQQALAIKEKALGKDSPALVPLLDHYATALAKLKRVEEAKEMLDRAVRLKSLGSQK